MAWATAATIISDAAIRLGLVASSIADPYASTDDNIVRLCSALKFLGKELLGAKDWSHLTEEHTFATVNGTPNYDTPSGFLRIVEQTAWNRTQAQELAGPLTNQQWQAEKARSTTSALQAFRLWQDDFWIHPTPSSAETIAYEYVSSLWVATTGAAAPSKAAPTLASDELWFDETLLHWGLRLLFKQDSGLDSTAEQRHYEDAWAAAAGGDGAAPVLRVTGPALRNFMTARVPDTGWGE